MSRPSRIEKRELRATRARELKAEIEGYAYTIAAYAVVAQVLNCADLDAKIRSNRRTVSARIIACFPADQAQTAAILVAPLAQRIVDAHFYSIPAQLIPIVMHPTPGLIDDLAKTAPAADISSAFETAVRILIAHRETFDKLRNAIFRRHGFHTARRVWKLIEIPQPTSSKEAQALAQELLKQYEQELVVIHAFVAQHAAEAAHRTTEIGAA